MKDVNCGGAGSKAASGLDITMGEIKGLCSKAESLHKFMQEKLGRVCVERPVCEEKQQNHPEPAIANAFSEMRGDIYFIRTQLSMMFNLIDSVDV